MAETILLFPKGKKEHIGKFKKPWFGSYNIQYCLLNNTILFVNIDKCEPNPVLANINNLKPFKYLGKTPKGLEATIKRGKEHMEDSKNKEGAQKGFRYGFTKNRSTSRSPKVVACSLLCKAYQDEFDDILWYHVLVTCYNCAYYMAPPSSFFPSYLFFVNRNTKLVSVTPPLLRP
jgi:hypothetical protein